MDDQVVLRPVAEDDLPLLYRLTSDPSATGQHEWFGWRDPGRFRRQWAENGLLSDDGGMLIVAAADQRLGFVSWRKHLIAGTSHCWVNRCGDRSRGPGTRDWHRGAKTARPVLVRTHAGAPDRSLYRDHQHRRAAGIGAGRIHPRGRPARRHLPRRPMARRRALQRAARRDEPAGARRSRHLISSPQSDTA